MLKCATQPHSPLIVGTGRLPEIHMVTGGSRRRTSPIWASGREIPVSLGLLSFSEEMQTRELLAVLILPCGLENRDRWSGARRKNEAVAPRKMGTRDTVGKYPGS